MKRLFELLYLTMTQTLNVSPVNAKQVLEADYLRSGEKARPNFLQDRPEAESKRTVANKRQKLPL
ncbi:MAG: hypothetical protein PHH11_11185 [Methylomonas sp.]|nr:hypothetical protein [Methylomonas sp.]